ncbi:MAG TPA: porin family protein [Bacteroidales bacterium]|nr:porin family protein [Bacteroidales bacterium]
MKKSVTIFLFILVVSIFQANAQRFQGELIAGMNKSQVDGDEAYRFKKYGLNFGAGVAVPVYKNWFASMELLYSEKGAYLKGYKNDTMDGSYRLHLNYLEVPVLFYYTDKEFISAGAGLSWGNLIKAWEKERRYAIPDVDLDTVYRKSDLNAIADLRVRIYKNLKLNVRYAYSIRKIGERDVRDSESGQWIYNNKQYNNFWTFRLIYMINEKPPANKKPNAQPD